MLDKQIIEQHLQNMEEALANLGRYKTLSIEAFESDKDVHSLTGSLISGLPYDEVRRQDKEGIHCAIGNHATVRPPQ